MKAKKSLILFTFLSLVVSGCSLMPARRTRKSSSDIIDTSNIDDFSTDSNISDYSSYAPTSEYYSDKREPTLFRSDYDIADYLILDIDKNVTGLSYIPDDGMLFVDYPVAPWGLSDLYEVETIFLGPHCNFLDEGAIACCHDLKNVIIDADVFPKLTSGTFSGTWYFDDLHVYVNDDIFEEALHTETTDTHWNDNCSQFLRKKSDIPSNVRSQLSFFTRATNTVIEFRVRFTDPDNTLIKFTVKLYEGSQFSAGYEDSVEMSSFSGLRPKNSYSIKVQYFYDLADGYGTRSRIISKTVKTRESISPYLIVGKDSSPNLNIDNAGYITGLKDDPENGVLFINNPIRSRAFMNINSFHTVVINQGCTSIGEVAFYYCDSLRTVIINRDSMPTLENDTFCGTWDPEDFKVYVPDEYYNVMKSTDTNDGYWNGEHRDRQMYKFSNLPADKLELTKSNINVTSNSFTYSFTLFDPDNTVVDIDLFLSNDGITFATASIYPSPVITGEYKDLSSNTTLRLLIKLNYYLIENGVQLTKTYEIHITTLGA